MTEEKKEEEGSFSCKNCGKSFETKDELDQHAKDCEK